MNLVEVKRQLSRLERLLIEEEYSVIGVEQNEVEEEYLIRIRNGKGDEKSIKKQKEDILVLI